MRYCHSATAATALLSSSFSLLLSNKKPDVIDRRVQWRERTVSSTTPMKEQAARYGAVSPAGFLRAMFESRDAAAREGGVHRKSALSKPLVSGD